jgi:hypothetical protein
MVQKQAWSIKNYRYVGDVSQMKREIARLQQKLGCAWTGKCGEFVVMLHGREMW